MGLRLTVPRRAWRARVESAAAERPDLIPVVKGNGYGFGRPTLMPLAATLAAGGAIAVGTVYEAADVPDGRTALVLTPHVDRLPPALPPTATLTIGSPDHVRVLAAHGWSGATIVKLASSMHRHGISPADLRETMDAARTSGMTVGGYGIHLPLAGTDEARCDEITRWLPHLDPTLPLAVSHLAPASYTALRASHPDRSFQIRSGTSLWHADRRLLQLSADVIDIHPAAGGSTAGYRAVVVPGDGHLVLVAAGSAHGVRPLDSGASPFHFARHRLTLLEPPHMHTSMLFVPADQPLPSPGDRVDVQRPLIETLIDELEWVDD